MRTVVVVIAGTLGIVALGGVLFLLSFRARFQPVLTVVRRLNRRFINPQQLRTAGQPGVATSVVHHRGRRSGTSYRTPVVAVPADGGFVIALPYGPGADWVRNVMAAGSAAIEHDGTTVSVERPRLVGSDEANPLFPAKEQRSHALVAMDEFLRLDRTAAVSPPGR